MKRDPLYPEVFDLPSAFEAEASKEVVNCIRIIEDMRKMSESCQDKLQESPASTGEYILMLLPKKVREFKYSQTLPDITATREIGTESWNANQALAWGLADANISMNGVVEIV